MSKGGTNTVSQETVPSWLQPYYTQALGQGANLLNQGGPAYPTANPVAPLSSMQNQGLNALSSEAAAPSATQGAEGWNQYATSGALLDPSQNPALQQLYNTGAQSIQDQVNSEYGANGRNVTASVPVQQNQLSDLYGSIYAPAYQAGLNATTQASALAPSIDQGSYLPSQQLLQGGALTQQEAQNQASALFQQQQYNAQLPYSTLDWYSSLVGQDANPFGGSSSTGTQSGSPLTDAAGAALAAYGLYNSGLFGGSAAAADAASAFV